MHTGGWSDKLGNRYEGRWIARQLLHLIEDNLQSVKVESVREDHVDVCVKNKDGMLEFHQCKRTIDGSRWSIRELLNRNVLKPLQARLSENAKSRYKFISTQQTELVRLTHLTSQVDDIATFLNAVEASKPDKKLWKEWCEAIGCSDDLNASFDYLRRSEFVVLGDGQTEFEELCHLAKYVLVGEPREVIALLAQYASDHMGRWVSADTLRQAIEKGSSFKIRDLAYSGAIRPAIEHCCEEYIQSIAPYLISGTLILRPEAQAILQSIHTGKKRFHILHGAFGQGKSGVLYQLVSLLNAEGIPHLSVRLDIHKPEANSREFGNHLGLPESPVRCLRALAGNQPSVLIIDQLDALHWSPQHDPSSWTVFLQMMNEVFQSDVTVHAVVACRTFDLQNDPNIKAWRRDKDRGTWMEEICVGDLPEDSASKVVEEQGQSWAVLTKAQQDLLRKPLHLYIWSQLVAESTSPIAFRTPTDLLRVFWNKVRETLCHRGCMAADIQSAIQRLVSRMDHDCSLTAPDATLDGWPKVRDGLLSLDILHRLGRTIRFVHQGYFEFLLATIWRDRLQYEGKSVFDWLNDNDEQSLLRRSQLRQLLDVIRDDDPAIFLQSVRNILNSEMIRFHLQHLTLQFLGSIATPTVEEGRLVARLVQDTKWREPVLSLVIMSRPQWFNVIDGLGLWETWLGGSEPWQQEAVCIIFSYVAETEQDRVLTLIKPFTSQPDLWPMRVWRILSRNPETDSDLAFSIRLELVAGRKAGRLDYLFSKEFARSRPRRVIELFAAICRSAPVISDEDGDTWPYWLSLHAAEAIGIAVESEPAFAWDNLLPCLIHAVDRHPVLDRTWDDGEFEPDALYCDRAYRFQYSSAEALPSILARAAASWSRVSFAGAREAIQPLLNHKARVVQQVVGTSWLLGDDQVADEAMRWLIANTARFDLSRIGKSVRGELARQLVARFGVQCASDVYTELESSVLRYYPVREKRGFAFRLKQYHNGERWYRPNEYGLAQYGLLFALPAIRRSKVAVNVLGQLAQKYGRSPENLYWDNEPKAGMVSSPISDRRVRLSDSAWMKLITTVGKGLAHRKFRSDFVESSPEMFSRDLESQASRDPSRFANLVLKAPRSILPIYWTAILRALRLTSSPDSTAAEWQPAAIDQCVAVLTKVGFDTNREVGIAFCNCVAHRPECADDSVLETICRYAADHLDPDYDGCVLPTDNHDRLETEAINTVRAVAAQAISEILFRTPEKTELVIPTLRSLTADPVACVRTATIRAIIPVLNFDRRLAVSLFLKTVSETNEEVLRTLPARRFVGYVIKDYVSQIQTLVEQMAGSASTTVAKDGAAWIAGIRLFMNESLQVFDRCVSGTPAQRRGVSETLAQYLDHEDVATVCRQLLPPFFDDSDLDVRKAAARVLRNEIEWGHPGNAKVLEHYFRSKAFLDEISLPMWVLDEFKGSLTDLADAIFAACDVCSSIESGGVSEHHGLDEAFRVLLNLLLRLYGQTDSAVLRRKSLDRLDSMLRNTRRVSFEVIRNLDS